MRRVERVLVVYKRTALERFDPEDPRFKRLLETQDASVASLRSAHEAHLETIERARAALVELGVEATFRHHHDPQGERWDMVVTLGGDGTLLWTSHTVDAQTPMVAINSDPNTSVGYFCAGDRDDVEDTLRAAIRGELRPTRLTRMRVRVDGETVHTRILNDALFCHPNPAATTRFIIRHRDIEESHTCSGIWVGPAAGSTAAQRSAGGRVLPIGSRKLQWVVREVYQPRDVKLQLVKGLVAPDETLTLKSKMPEGRLYFDGAQKIVHVAIGAEIVMQRSDETLTLLGLRSRGR